jgi:DegV family protein with EDD domain
MSKKIALITDSTCDIPPEMRQQYDLHVVPLYLIWGHEELKDEVEITADQFYERLPRDHHHPTTSQPTPADFVKKYEELAAAGYDEAVVITISDKLSGTLDSATQAKAEVDFTVHLYDSRSVSMGLGWQVLAAARARENGADAAGMIAAADRARRSGIVMFTVDTLEYLHRGGRIGAAAKLLGTALQLKPQLLIDHENGIVEAGERIRTRSKAIESVYKGFFSRLDTSQPLHVTVLHIAAEEEAGEIAERVRADFPSVELFVTKTSPVIGVHGGPGTLGLVGYSGE